MNKLATFQSGAPGATRPTRPPGAKRILAAYEDAQRAGETAVQKALICGQLLIEQREAMSFCHDGKNLPWQGRKKPEADQFVVWLADNCPAIPERTAYRWMKAAERSFAVLKLPHHFDIEAEVIALSSILTMPRAELSASAAKAQQLWLDFTADKSLADCLRDVIDGESPDHRIARAYNGKYANHSGGGGDRKEFEKFAALKLRHLTTFLRAKLHTNQKGLIVSAFNAALEAWPRWALEALSDKCRAELKLSDEERGARTDF